MQHNMSIECSHSRSRGPPLLFPPKSQVIENGYLNCVDIKSSILVRHRVQISSNSSLPSGILYNAWYTILHYGNGNSLSADVQTKKTRFFVMPMTSSNYTNYVR